jgi:hypothetical protein
VKQASKWIHRSLTLCALGALGTLGGCNLAAIIAVPLANAEKEGSSKVEAEYKGLSGKTFAVLISAPPVIQASFGETVPRMTIQISEILAKSVNASGYVPGPKVIEYQYNRPNWVAKPLGEVAKDLGVDRLVYIDLSEYRLQDIGNQYLWDGVAAGLVAVVEADGSTPDDFRFQKRISVKFPDQGGYGPSDMPLGAVNTELTNRFVLRATWLFFDHEEANKLKY